MTSQDLADRYGAPAPWLRPLVVAVTVVVAAAFLGWLAWTVWFHSSPAVSSEMVSFDVVDDHTASAVVDVRVDEEASGVECVLRAYAEDHATVGEKTFSPARGFRGETEVEVRTERRATSVTLLGCTADGQERPR